ncbi:hypothetical protein DFP72DRAFT_888886 [Ephemerocybe angulata]|uniref:Secreted protein n=1 Tax=Ephemerocybe angulata TaxID=980116 RepID=A0A8H6I6N5_9AGAR|nr:hypothetical protein DFP72DRAFT_888886 [Tulosesus angulatus]
MCTNPTVHAVVLSAILVWLPSSINRSKGNSVLITPRIVLNCGSLPSVDDSRRPHSRSLVGLRSVDLNLKPTLQSYFLPLVHFPARRSRERFLLRLRHLGCFDILLVCNDRIDQGTITTPAPCPPDPFLSCLHHPGCFDILWA